MRPNPPQPLSDGPVTSALPGRPTPDPALGHPILPRTTDGRPHGVDVHEANRAGHFAAILAIMVEQEKLAGRFVREGFS